MQNCPDYLSWLPVPSNTQVYAVPGLICQTNQKIVTRGVVVVGWSMLTVVLDSMGVSQFYKSDLFIC